MYAHMHTTIKPLEGRKRGTVCCCGLILQAPHVSTGCGKAFPSRSPVYTQQQGDMKQSARRGGEGRGGEVEESKWCSPSIS